MSLSKNKRTGNLNNKKNKINKTDKNKNRGKLMVSQYFVEYVKTLLHIQ